MPTKVHVIKTGVANLASVKAGLERAGAEVVFTQSAKDVQAGSHVVLPGVGAFGAGMAALEEFGLQDAIAERISKDKAMLSVCVGLQLLFSESEESPGVKGLSIFPEKISRFSDTVRVPQLGWNKVSAGSSARFIEDGFAYFANSYRALNAFEGWQVSTADHGGPFVAAIEKGNVLAAQFHPELSGDWGLGVLKRWVNQ